MIIDSFNFAYEVKNRKFTNSTIPKPHYPPKIPLSPKHKPQTVK